VIDVVEGLGVRDALLGEGKSRGNQRSGHGAIVKG
jgi:hypothetical protein